MLSRLRVVLISRALAGTAIAAAAATVVMWSGAYASAPDTTLTAEADSAVRSGPPISKVRWEGLDRLDAGLLEGESRLREGERFSDPLLEAELARLDSLCFARGLLGARVAVDTTMRGDAVEVTILVSEGEPARIGGVTVSGAEAMTADDVISKLGVRRGSLFDPSALEMSMKALLTELNRSGYPYAQVWMTGFEYDPESNTVDLNFAVYGGEESVVENVVFDGIAGTDTSLALRTSRLRKGEPFDEEKLERARRYLSASGLFASVGRPEVRRLGPGRVDVNIPVKEKKRVNSIQGIFGFSKKESGGYVTSGSVDIALRNLGGSGRDVDFRWLDDGAGYRTLHFRYSEDFFLSLPPGSVRS